MGGGKGGEEEEGRSQKRRTKGDYKTGRKEGKEGKGGLKGEGIEETRRGGKEKNKKGSENRPNLEVIGGRVAKRTVEKNGESNEELRMKVDESIVHTVNE